MCLYCFVSHRPFRVKFCPQHFHEQRIHAFQFCRRGARQNERGARVAATASRTATSSALPEWSRAAGTRADRVCRSSETLQGAGTRRRCTRAAAGCCTRSVRRRSSSTSARPSAGTTRALNTAPASDTRLDCAAAACAVARGFHRNTAVSTACPSACARTAAMLYTQTGSPRAAGAVRFLRRPVARQTSGHIIDAEQLRYLSGDRAGA